jgi:hypothetical protein
MSRFQLTVIGLAGLALVLCVSASATTGSESWEQLQQLRPGDQIRVELLRNPELRGKFAAVTPDSLQMTHGNEQHNVGRAEVRRVYHLVQRSRAVPMLVGTAAGFGGGFAIGYAVSKNAIWSRTQGGAVGGVPLAGIGAVIGYFAAGKSQRLVYQAR